MAGNDTIYGGADDDSIDGDGTLPAGGPVSSADGDDAYLLPEAGNDTVSGGGGADTIFDVRVPVSDSLCPVAKVALIVFQRWHR